MKHKKNIFPRDSKVRIIDPNSRFAYREMKIELCFKQYRVHNHDDGYCYLLRTIDTLTPLLGHYRSSQLQRIKK